MPRRSRSGDGPSFEHLDDGHPGALGVYLDGTERIDVYGVPRGGVVNMIKQLASSGAPLNMSARPVAGFTRSATPVTAP